jgi:hypothetical protein
MDNKKPSQDDLNKRVDGDGDNLYQKNAANTSQASDTNPLFRKNSRNKLSSPEQLDHVLEVVTPKGWIALFGILVLLITVILWSIFGIIPVEVKGKGIILTEGGIFSVVADQPMIVEKVYVKLDDWVDEGEVLATVLITEKNIKKEILASKKGRIIEVDIAEGQFLSLGTQLFSLEHPQEEGQNLVIHSFFPLNTSNISKGMKAKISIETLDSGSNGFLIAEVSDVSFFPVSDKDLLRVLRNPQLIEYIKGSSLSVYPINLTPITDAQTLSGYKWTSGKGPSEFVKSGALCDVLIITKMRSPISYIFPFLFKNKEKLETTNPNLFPKKQGLSS